MTEQMAPFSIEPQNDIAYDLSGTSIEHAPFLVVWGHGWGQSGNAFSGMASGMPRAANLLIDFPGFGRSAPPPNNWGTAEYADACALLIAKLRRGKKVIWIGHSFGGRVGIQLAARHPELLDGLCLIAAAGLPRTRKGLDAIRINIRIMTFKLMKKILSFSGGDIEALKLKYGSADYRNAGSMREVFVRVVNENLGAIAQRIRCPSLLIYGGLDTETPPEIGERLAQLIPSSELSVLANQDHYSLLGSGRHLVLKKLTDFIGKL